MRKKNGFLSILLTVVLIFQMTGCVAPDFWKEKPESETENPPQEEVPVPAPPEKESPKEYVYDGSQGELSLYGYSQLTDDQKLIYAALCEGIENFQEEISMPVEFSEWHFYRTLYAVFSDHPEYFWTDIYWFEPVTCSIINTKFVLSCRVRYFMSPEKAKTYREMIELRAEEILEETKGTDSEFQTVQYLHDYIISHSDYDSAAVGKYAPSDRLKGKYNLPEEYHSAYSILGFFTRDRIVCAGYSKLFQYLLARAGIWSIYVTGHSRDTGHAWNIVRIDGEYYGFDLTWDDPVNEDGSGGNLLYDYFGVTTEEMSADHTFDSEYYSYPSCTATACNYYRYYGRYVERYDYDLFYRAISLAAANGEDGVTFRCSSKSVLDNCSRILFDRYAVFDILKSLPRGPKPFLRSSVFSNVHDEKLLLTISFQYDE